MPELSRCALDLGPFCLTRFELLLPGALLLLLFVAGALSSRHDAKAHRKRLALGLKFSTVPAVIGLAGVAWFLVFDSGTVYSSSTEPAAQTLWIIAASLLAAGVSLLSGVGAYAAGGWAMGHGAKPSGVRLLIAIDGPAASGKGTLAKRIAAHYDLAWLDTGLLYRAVARDVLATGGQLDDVGLAVAAAQKLDSSSLGDPDLRGPRAGEAASIVAKVPEVRAALLAYQRAFAEDGRGAVLDGRDIGTVVCPDAHVKIFVMASDEARAQRRFLEHQSRGDAVVYEELLADIRARDARDFQRATAPMKAAADAITLDTTELDADQAFAAAIAIVDRVRPAR